MESEVIRALKSGKRLADFGAIWSSIFAPAFTDRPVMSTFMPRPAGSELSRSSMTTFWGLPTCATKTNFPRKTSDVRSTPVTLRIVSLALLVSICAASSADTPTRTVPIQAAHHCSNTHVICQFEIKHSQKLYLWDRGVCRIQILVVVVQSRFVFFSSLPRPSTSSLSLPCRKATFSSYESLVFF